MPGSTEFDLHFENAAFPEHTVPASVLLQSLEWAQRTIYVLALAAEKKPAKQRLKFSQELERNYSLMCSVPVTGSYNLPSTIGDATADLYVEADSERVAGMYKQLLSALDTGENGLIRELIPDSVFRKRALEGVRNTVPKVGSGWELGISNGSMKRIRLNERFRDVIDEVFKQESVPEEVLQTVTGKLVGIFFDERRLTIQYPNPVRQLECFYELDLEEMLLERRREMIQVTGLVVLDENGIPKKITGVERIEDLDLSPFVVESLSHAGQALKLASPLTLYPSLDDDTQQLLCLEHEKLGIFVYAHTREELLRELQEQLSALWQEYAQASPSTLTRDAQQLRTALLEVLSVAPNA